jgi:hypothetical protein
MLLRFLVIAKLIFALEFFLADLAIKLAFMLFFLFAAFVRDRLIKDLGWNIINFVLLPVVFLDFAEALLFQALFDMFHFFLLFLFFLLTLKPFLLLFLFLFPKTADIGDKAGISLTHVG